jgi:prepilin signal peptidase PulO-like enzyme (type II secretory pathway)
MIYVFLAIVGAAMGSFSGAVVWRLRKKKDFVRDRSECEKCHHKLGTFDLIPIFSYIFLRGRCRYCRKPIVPDTLLIELTGAVLFTLSYLLFPLEGVGTVVKSTTLFVLWLTILVGFMILGLYDTKYGLLPNKILFPTMAVAGIYFAVDSFWVAGVEPLGVLGGFVLSLLPITGLYGLLYLIGEKTGRHLVGFGDVKLGIVIAFLLSWDSAFIVLFLANVLGALFSLFLVLTKRKKITSLIPFGPFLILATILVFLLQINLENTIAFMYNV